MPRRRNRRQAVVGDGQFLQRGTGPALDEQRHVLAQRCPGERRMQVVNHLGNGRARHGGEPRRQALDDLIELPLLMDRDDHLVRVAFPFTSGQRNGEKESICPSLGQDDQPAAHPDKNSAAGIAASAGAVVVVGFVPHTFALS